MQRRTLLVLSPAAALAGCGFKLRGQQDFAFKTFASSFVESSQLGNELARNMESGGEVRVVRDAARAAEAQVFMDVLNDTREKTVVGVGTAGQVREFQLRVRLKFKLRTPQGKELIPETELLQQRDVSFNETAVLAKESEEGLLYRSMQSDIVQQVLRRLAAVREL
jgi:LPS-assembly lipoprotein